MQKKIFHSKLNLQYIKYYGDEVKEQLLPISDSYFFLYIYKEL